MAKVFLTYDETRPVRDDPDVEVEFIVKDLPNVCLRCGAPAVEFVDLFFADEKERRLAAVRAPVCTGHPMLGCLNVMTILFLVGGGFFILIFFAFHFMVPRLSDVCGMIIFPIIFVFFALGFATRFGLVGFDIRNAKIETQGVEVPGVSEDFVRAYRKYWSAKKQHERDKLYGKSTAKLVQHGAFLDVEDEGRPEPAKKPFQKAKRLKRRTFKDMANRPATFIALGILFAISLTFIILIVVMADKTKKGGSPVIHRPPTPNPIKDKNPEPKPKPNPVDPFTPPDAPKNRRPIAAGGIKGLLAYWPLDEGKGVEFADVSANRQTANLISGTWIDGVRGSALSFDGRNDYADLGGEPHLNFGQSKPFTFCMWIATKDDDGTIISFRNAKRAAPVIDVQVAGGKISATVRGNRLELGQAVVTGKVVNDGKWHHIALQRLPDGHIELFLDAQSQGKVRGFNSQDAITTDLRALGCERYWVRSKANLGDPYFRGAIDEVCVFDRVLDADEIATLAGKRK